MNTTTEQVTWVSLGAEVSLDRAHTWVAACGVTGGRVVVVHVHDPWTGTDAAPLVMSLWQRLGVQWVALDPRSPSATLVDPLRDELGAALKLADTIDVQAAHGKFVDLLNAGRVRLRGHRGLDPAMQAAEERRLAGGQAVQRYAGTDMGPLLAAELGVWALPADLSDAGGISPGAWTL